MHLMVDFMTYIYRFRDGEVDARHTDNRHCI